MNNSEKKFTTVEISGKESLSVRFLYNTSFGRAVLKLLVKPSLSNLMGKFMNTAFSRLWIKGFIKRNSIDMSQYEDRKFNSFNDFFTRKILPGKREFDTAPSVFASPCDSKLSVYRINSDSVFNIKHCKYTVGDLICDENLAEEYINGYCLIFRLSTDDYHRYAHIDNGKVTSVNPIKGILHTVRPIAQDRYPIFAQNSREYTVIETENFGKIVQIEVGAMLIGRISNIKDQTLVTRGCEKGMFEFGGSTIIMLVKENTVEIDNELLENTENNKESIVKMGMQIGCKII